MGKYCSTCTYEIKKITSYPNDTAITVIKNPKNASSFLRPDTKSQLYQKN